MQKIKCLFVCLTFCVSWSLMAQDMIPNTFSDRRVILSHSVEMLPAKKLDIRIGHLFGDMLGEGGGWKTLYGLENASDISIGAEYGITNHINVGVFRTKGAGELRQNVHLLAKSRLMQQQKNTNKPISIGVVGMLSYSTMASSTGVGLLNNFSKPAYRFSYHMQVMFARRIGKRLSLQTSLNYTYRNLVYTFDQNDLPSIGVCAKVQLTKVIGLLLEGTFVVLDNRKGDKPYQHPLGFGLEFNTGGHVFQINLTNAKGLAETDYIPYTFSDWGKGEFRLGFTISRKFNL